MSKMKDLEIQQQNNLADFKDLQRRYVRLIEENEELQKKLDNLLRIQLNSVNFGCPDCGKELHWESDVDMDDFMDEEGYISFYHCCNCNLEVEVRRYEVPEECACEDNDIPF